MPDPADFLAAVRAEHRAFACFCTGYKVGVACPSWALARAVEAVWILTCDASTMELRPLPNYRPIQATDIRQAITDALEGTDR